MTQQKTTGVLTKGLGEHEAVRAWSQLHSDHAEPVSIEVLKQERKCAAYRLNGIGWDGTSVIAKRCRAATARVQRLIYEEILPRMPVPALRCYGFLEEQEGEFGWLFLQDAAEEPYCSQLAEHRALAGSWLGRVHLAPINSGLKARLPVRGLGHHLELLLHCRATLLDHLAYNSTLQEEDAVVFHKIAGHCEVLEAHWNELAQICNVIPPAVVHGDFAVKNVRVRSTAAGLELLVFDWEHGGWGLPVIDLAQVASRVITPDLCVYCSVLKSRYAELELRDVQRAAECGNVLRIVNEITWANSSLRFGSHLYLSRPVATLKIYEPRLDSVLRALDWN